MKHRDLLYGTLLGDSWIYKDKRNNYCFRFCQSNKEYAKWKADLLGYECKYYDVHRLDKRTGKIYTNLTVHLKLSAKNKKELYEIFYTPKKSVTVEILNSLTDLGITLWYLDDGNMFYNGNNCHLTLSVNGFSEKEQLIIVDFFKKKYDIKFTKTKTCIRLTSMRECEKFMKIVEKYIPKCMEYKKLNNVILKYKLLPKKIRKVKQGKEVFQYSAGGKLIKKWNSVKEIATELKIDRSTIYQNIHGKTKFCKQFKWKY